MSKGLSNTDFEVLQYLWAEKEPRTFGQIMEYFNTVGKKDWKKQTVNTFLLRLKQKGVIKAERVASKTLYEPAITPEEYYQDFAQKILEDSFGGSLKNFVAAFTGKQKLSREEKIELLDYIEKM